MVGPRRRPPCVVFFLASLSAFFAAAFCAFLDMGLSPPSAGLAAAWAFFSAAAFFFAAFLSTIAIGCAGSSLVISSLILTCAQINP